MDSRNIITTTLERPLTILELCDYLCAKKSTIDQYNREGMPRFYVGKECRYIPSKVIHWLERRAKDRVQSPTEETFDPLKELGL
jgi:hypothetical protein